MSDHDQKKHMPPTGANATTNAPTPGSPLQPGADGNPQAMPVPKPDAVMPERQPVRPSKDRPTADAPPPRNKGHHMTENTGNEDPGSEVEDLPASPASPRR